MNHNTENTEVLIGYDDILKRALETFSDVKEEWVGCIDHTKVTMYATIEPIWNAFILLNDKGIKIRIITGVTPANILYCKKLLDIVQLRHMSGYKNNFGVADRRQSFLLTTSSETQPLSHAIFSSFKGLAEAQQNLFETLWSKSIPVEQRIREIEEGIVPDTIEVIYDHSKVRALYLDLVNNAKSEIMLILPTVNAFNRQHKINAILCLNKSARERSVDVRILMPLLSDTKERAIVKEKIVETINRKQKENDNKEENENMPNTIINNDVISSESIEMRYIQPMPEPRSTILLVDGKLSLVMELKDDMGKTFEEAIGLSIYSNSKPGVFSYVSIFENLWLQSDLYQQIKEVNDKLEIRDKILNEFIHIAAHELRNPIQPILSLTQVLRSKITLVGKEHITVDEVTYILDTILRNARKVNRLTDNVLDIAKIDSNLLDLKKEIFDLREVVQFLADDYILEYSKVKGNNSNNNNNYRNIKLSLVPSSINTEEEKDLKTDQFLVEADKGRISQVICNIINNALKFTNKGDTISIAVEKENIDGMDHVTVSVRDTGIGIDAEVLPRLFTKFATKSNSGGTGLGMFLSKRIIEEHKGRIWAKNNIDGKGSTFSFSLPLH